ncbi:unnamed protein product [Cyclocybe aegerita]|uniref:HNH nuclease domain-containing protein n=1 Tax=Cyclocybe aegerita TaxID=1973307 RepID=A0A8S0W3B6_CYCAE|nr:unnamed protein product [Cyclocybe aegerita]
MPPLPPFSLPLPARDPPLGYGWEARDVSALSTTTAFDTGIDQRDVFLGRPRCIVCGMDVRTILQHCHIIPVSEDETWRDLKRRRWLPSQAKDRPRHEPRDGMLMCRNCHSSFNSYHFFIRFLPDSRKFVFVNYSEEGYFQPFHGKAVALDLKDRYAPFPALFIIHEMRVRGFHPFKPTAPTMPDIISWQDWILSGGVLNSVSDSFRRDLPPGDDVDDVQPLPQLQSTMSAGNTGSESSGGHTLALNEDVIAQILEATWASPSWKACQMEGTSWDGTAEENMQKYVSSIGVEDSVRDPQPSLLT